jgi:hypothetical protein
MALGQYLERLRMAVNRSVEIRGDQDILVQQTDGGTNLKLNRVNVIKATSPIRWFEVTALSTYKGGHGQSAVDRSGNPVIWNYSVKEKFKRHRAHGDFDGTGPWQDLTDGFVGTAYNHEETNNTASTSDPQQSTGVVHGGSYPSTWDMTPLKIGAIYPGVLVDVVDNLGVVEDQEIWLWGPTGEDGQCA